MNHRQLDIDNSGLIRNDGYGAHVVIGETYTITGLNWVGDIYFVLGDPELAIVMGNAPEDEFVNLVLEMKTGDSRTCTVNARFIKKYG